MRLLGFRKRLQESSWLLGICLNGMDDLKDGRIHWIHNGKYDGKKWFADPFILDYDENTINLLVEEFDYVIHRGRIAKISIERKNWTVKDCIILLDLDTHLSFPMIWHDNDIIYVCPENYHSGGWHLYRYNRQDEKLEYVKKLSDVYLTDATIWKDKDGYYLFSTFEPKPNGSELTIWHSTSFTGTYHKCQCVEFEENVGRNAGMLFQYNGKLIRPAQESNRTYGHSIVFQEVNLINGIFTFKEVFRYCSSHPIYDAGTHTFNTHNGMAVIDVKGYRYRRIAKAINLISRVLVKLYLKKPYVIQ